MSLFPLLAVALALAMDAFAVAVVTGLTLHPVTRRQVFRLAFHFGLFQALMPVVGWREKNLPMPDSISTPVLPEGGVVAPAE